MFASFSPSFVCVVYYLSIFGKICHLFTKRSSRSAGVRHMMDRLLEISWKFKQIFRIFFEQDHLYLVRLTKADQTLGKFSKLDLNKKGLLQLLFPAKVAPRLIPFFIYLRSATHFDFPSSRNGHLVVYGTILYFLLIITSVNSRTDLISSKLFFK